MFLKPGPNAELGLNHGTITITVSVLSTCVCEIFY
jgi:hypothetical protein